MVFVQFSPLNGLKVIKRNPFKKLGSGLSWSCARMRIYFRQPAFLTYERSAVRSSSLLEKSVFSLLLILMDGRIIIPVGSTSFSTGLLSRKEEANLILGPLIWEKKILEFLGSKWKKASSEMEENRLFFFFVSIRILDWETMQGVLNWTLFRKRHGNEVKLF